MQGSEQSTAGSGDILDRIEAAMEPVEAPAAQTAEVSDEPVDETTEEETLQTDEEQEDTEEKSTEESEETDDEEEEPGLELAPEEFAALLGVDSDLVEVDAETGEVLLRTKVGEETGKVSLKDLLKSYQTDKYVTQKSQAVSEAQKAFETERNNYLTQANAKLNEAAGLAQIFEQQLLSEFNAVDWNQLRATNPGEYAARQHEFSGKQAALQQAKAQLGAQAQQLSAEQKQAQDDKMSEVLKAEHDRLVTAIPEWSDSAVAAKEKTAIGEYMVKNYGFSEADLENITDHRAVLVVRDAMRYREGKAKTTIAEKKVKALPRIAKPGTNKKKSDPNSTAAKARHVRLKKTGNVSDLAALLESRM